MASAFLRGVLAGLLVAAPVGPMALLAIRRTLDRGLPSGIASGLGIATADGILAALAALGLSAATSLLLAHARPVQAAGGAVMIVIGGLGLRAPQATAERRAADPAGLLAAYGSCLLLTLANPPTLLTFLALLAGAGLLRAGDADRAALVAGVFAGSAGWWLALTAGVARAGRRLDGRRRRLVTRASAAAMAALGAAVVASAALSR